MIPKLLQLDGGLLIFIQESCVHPFLTPILTFITHLGDRGYLWIAITVLLLLFKKTRKAGFACLIALLCSGLIDNVILKNAVARMRPYDALDGVKLLIERQKDFSFPSGHTGTGFAVAGVIFFSTKRKYGIPILCFAGLIAFTRLYLGVHYPTDVLAGVIIGLLLAYFSVNLVEWFLQKYQKR